MRVTRGAPVSPTEARTPTEISTGASTAETAPTACTHCALAIPAERRRSGSPYCCAGCEVVSELLQQHGLTRFYDLGGRSLGAVGAVPRPADLDWLADAAATATTGDGVVRLVLDVQGVRCAACVWLLQELWRQRDGALRIDVDPSIGRLQLVYRRGAGDVAAFLSVIARFGYRVAPARRAVASDTGLLVRLGICAALAMNAMILAFAQYFGLAAADPALSRLFGWVSLGLGTASVAVGGPVFFRSALGALRHRVVHMDLPIALGIGLAWAGSVAAQTSGGEGYFDTVAIFVALMLTGRFLQQRALQKNRDQVLADDGAEHLRARVLRDGGVATVPVTAVQKGEVLLLAPGDLLPVRARPLADASFSLDWIDGESVPKAFAAGVDVPAGAFLAGRAAVRVTVTAGYRESGMADLLQAKPADREDAGAGVGFWRRLNRWYAVGVLVAAGLGGGAWLLIDPTRALAVTVAVLVVTCPCALGIATPLAFHLALARLRRHGVFVRSGALLDKLPLVRKVIFDKTGTVTIGGLVAEPVKPVPAGARDVAGTLAASSSHPASQAVLAALGGGFAFRADLQVAEVPGQGVKASVDGREWRLGSAAFAGVPAGGGAEVVLARDGEVVARHALRENFRDGAADEVRRLRARGLQVHLMSGDRPDRAAVAARALGIEPGLARGGMSPGDKAAAVGAIDRRDTLMLGDGLNDAPAFAAAFCAGTPAIDRPVLPARADFFYAGAAAGSIAQLFAVAFLLRRVVRGNLRRALAYNAAVIGLSLAGLMTPLLCAVLMPLSSLVLVIGTGLRFARAGGPR